VPTLNHPFWLEPAKTTFPGLEGNLDVDVAVVGAGITGATTALLLKQAGLTVALLDSGHLCSGATGYTTAKLTVGHNLVYADLLESFGIEIARRYARSNQAVIERVARSWRSCPAARVRRPLERRPPAARHLCTRSATEKRGATSD
jgi:glycine/D-amino acid oxidase-like deaminating enzyme